MCHVSSEKKGPRLVVLYRGWIIRAPVIFSGLFHKPWSIRIPSLTNQDSMESNEFFFHFRGSRGFITK